jgi:hypothetical protein
VYRFRQFFSALAARTDDDDDQELARLLTPPQQDLFRRMAPNDQRHSLKVCATLRRAGCDDPALLTAALLHDVGKSAGRIWLWQRALIVLLQRWAPGLLRWLARGTCSLQPATRNPQSTTRNVKAPQWRRGFVINRLHPELGARWAAESGCSPTAVALIRRHQEPIREASPRDKTVKNDQDQLLAALQWADRVN